MPVPAPQIPLTAETYWLEYSEGTWELYTCRGSKGRTRHTEHCCCDFAAARRHALTLAARTGTDRGAVLHIHPFHAPRQIHYFYPVNTWPLNSPAVTVHPCQCQLLSDTGQPARPLTIAENTPVTFLYRGADNDGWNGELICRLSNGRDAAFEPGDIGLQRSA